MNQIALVVSITVSRLYDFTKSVSFLGSLFLVGSFFAISQKSAIAQSKDGLVVHEWGTFTTLASSKGELLGGLYLDEEKLPDFVHEEKEFPFELKNTQRFKRHKGIYFEPLNVTVKMETPVIYFYSPQPLHASVHVDFPTGFIGQWFPSSIKRNIIAEDSKEVDFSKPVNGFMDWKVNVLSPGIDKRISFTQSSHTWGTPRNTDANLISFKPSANSGSTKIEEVEKFIFYRGIANFNPPVTAKFMGDTPNSQIEINNTGDESIPYVLVYEKDQLGNKYLYWQGEIQKGQKQLADRKNKQPIDFNSFELALVKAGLYNKEAKAMLETWRESYFEKPGIRIFYIVPEKFVDKVLPLKIDPQPQETKRVFVGRYEILSPEFEASLYKMWNNKDEEFIFPKEETESFYLAYKELVEKRFNAK